MFHFSKQSLIKSFDLVQEYFSPKVIASVNDVYVKVAKLKGDLIPWHNHEHEDELFYVVKGSFLFEIKGQESFTMNEGDLFVVPKGVEHKVSAKAECWIVLIENKTTAHTGEVHSAVTKSIEEQLL